MKEGRYLYCVVNAEEKANLGSIGIEEGEVYTLPFKGIAAVVHRCDARPYDTREKEKARDWILDHLYTIDEAARRFGTPLPFRFDTIIRGGDEKVLGWMGEEYGRLKGGLERVKGKAEYGVQVFWDRGTASEEIAERGEIRELAREMEAKPKGAAYMLRRRMEKMLREELAKEAEERRREFYELIQACGAKIKVERKAVKSRGEEMLLSLACLADRAQVEKLGKVLDDINAKAGVKVRFTGPWAPFSFAGGIEDETGEG